jgi:hypothetical protein
MSDDNNRINLRIRFTNAAVSSLRVQSPDTSSPPLDELRGSTAFVEELEVRFWARTVFKKDNDPRLMANLRLDFLITVPIDPE